MRLLGLLEHHGDAGLPGDAAFAPRTVLGHAAFEAQADASLAGEHARAANVRAAAFWEARHKQHITSSKG